VRAAMKNIWTMPGLYAMIAGLAVNLLHIQLPTVLFDPIKMIGDSLVPYLLILMGLQLTRASFRGNLTIAFVAGTIRLVAAAVIGTGLASVMGLQGVTRQAMIIENSMPSAIFGVALAQEFDAAPELITVIITISTLMSLFTLTVLIAVT